MNKVLLKKFVRSVINEDIDFAGGGHEMGIDYTGGDSSKLYKIFVQPFTDVFSTASGETKKLSQKLQTLTRVSYRALISILNPFIQSEYDEIFEDEKQQIEKIKAQYKDVHDRTWTAIKDNDIMSAAFMYDPSSLITAKAIRRAPIPVLNTLNILAGGRLDNFISKVKASLKTHDARKMLDADSGTFIESILHEKQEFNIVKSLTQPSVKQAINDSPLVQRMRSDVRKTIRGSLEKMFDHARSIVNAKSVADIASLAGASKLKEIDQLQKLKEPERSQVEQQVLQAMKQSAKAFYNKKILGTIESALKAGVPESNAMIKDYKNTMKKIAAL